jgi:hypothetical protein
MTLAQPAEGLSSSKQRCSHANKEPKKGLKSVDGEFKHVWIGRFENRDNRYDKGHAERDKNYEHKPSSRLIG